MKTLLSEIAASKSIKLRIRPFLTMKGHKSPGGAFLLGHNQSECKRDNFILVIVFQLGSKKPSFSPHATPNRSEIGDDLLR